MKRKKMEQGQIWVRKANSLLRCEIAVFVVFECYIRSQSLVLGLKGEVYGGQHWAMGLTVQY